MSIDSSNRALKIGKHRHLVSWAFDTFLWIFWLGLTIPLIEVIWTNRRACPDHVHRFSVVYGLTTDDILLVRTLYLFISTVLTGHASELLFLYSVRMGNVIFFYSLTYPHSYPYPLSLFLSHMCFHCLTKNPLIELLQHQSITGYKHQKTETILQICPVALSIFRVNCLLLDQRIWVTVSCVRLVEVRLSRKCLLHHPGLSSSQSGAT